MTTLARVWEAGTWGSLAGDCFAAGTGCQPAHPRLLSRKARPVTSTQCSQTPEPSASLLPGIKICSDKLSATAEM